METVLTFEQLPEELPFSKKIKYCIVDISGIQRYIFHDIDRCSTEQIICARSEFVEMFTEYIETQLSNMRGYLSSSASSGKLLCCFHPLVRERTIRALLDRLQRSVFASTQGQLTFFYALCTAKCIPESQFRPNDMVRANEILKPLLEKAKLHCINLLDVDMVREADGKLADSAAVRPVAQQFTQRTIADQAAVKLDLDNLGAFFHEITAFDRHHTVSQELEKVIKGCLDHDDRILKIFTGGDDIFFLCPLQDALTVVSDFYCRLKSAFGNNPNLERYAREHFGISAGICAIRHRLDQNLTLLSYLERTEAALAAAKTKGNKNCVYVQLTGSEQQYISWEHLCYLAEQYSLKKDSLLAQHRLTGTDYININLLADQLAGKKEVRKLNEIKRRSV